MNSKVTAFGYELTRGFVWDGLTFPARCACQPLAMQTVSAVFQSVRSEVLNLL